MNTHGLNNTAVSRSIESIQLKKYYYRTSRRLKSRGLLRTDLGEADSPYTSKNLIENFEKIALYDEYIIKVIDEYYLDKLTEPRLQTAIKINEVAEPNIRKIKIDKKISLTFKYGYQV